MIHLILYDYEYENDKPKHIIFEGPEINVEQEYENWRIDQIGRQPLYTKDMTKEQIAENMEKVRKYMEAKISLKWEDFFNHLICIGFHIVEFKEYWI